MLNLLTTFSALSLCGTALLAMLPDGGIKRTASMAVGLITLLCWAEGICALLGWELSVASPPQTVLIPTAHSVDEAAASAAKALAARWEAQP